MKKKKKKHLSGCGNDWHFMVDGINISRDLKNGPWDRWKAL
jgi:hypothetical protein